MITSVVLSEELRAAVVNRIAAFEIEAPENRRWLGVYAKRHNILPLFSNWLETLGITPDGLVRKFSADGDVTEYEGLREPTSRPEFILALVEGAKLYPELGAVLPVRPGNATVCSSCGGSGVLPGTFKCVCGGLGWLPAGAS